MNPLHVWQKELATTGWTGVFSTVADIVLVAVVVYWLIVVSRRTRAWQVIIGLMIFLMLVFLTDRLQLHELNYLLKSFVPLGPLAIVMLFYPELRHTLENLGRVAAWGRSLAMLPKEDVSSLIQVVVRASMWMSQRKIGALIVIEREGALDDIAATGTGLNAELSENLLGSIFYPGNPLHDGAVIIRATRIIAAGCTLPLSESAHIGTMVHTRHKAALGVAEESDVAVVVVSEETGTVSLAIDGKLHRGLSEESLTKWLRNLIGPPEDRDSRSHFARKVDGTLRKARILRK